ncbi:MAG: hypothetical protein LBR12_02100, partial [Opitutaceae bacterium]|nr:hypothetical protein [Opitutaceae bacterium]
MKPLTLTLTDTLAAALDRGEEVCVKAHGRAYRVIATPPAPLTPNAATLAAMEEPDPAKSFSTVEELMRA